MRFCPKCEMKRGRLVWFDCRAHDPEVAGSNPAPASNHDGHAKYVRRNIVLFSELATPRSERSLISASFTKITDLLRHRKRCRVEGQITYVKRFHGNSVQHYASNRVCTL